MTVEEYIKGVQEARYLLLNQREPEAIDRCGILISKRPERIGAYLLLALIYTERDELSKAEEIIKEAKNHNGDPALDVSLGIVQTKQKNHGIAISTFRSIDVSVRNSKFHFYFAKSLVAEGEIKEGIGQYQKCLALDRANKAAWNNLANLYQQTGNMQEAIQCYQHLMKLFPQDAIPYLNLGSLFEKEQKADEALKCYQSSLKKDPKLSAAYFNLAQLLANNFKDYKAALDVLEKGQQNADESFQKGIRFYQIVYRKLIGDWSSFSEDITDLNKIIEQYLKNEAGLPFEIVPYALSHFELKGHVYRQVAERYAKKIIDDVRVKYSNISFDHTPSNGKVKIGYYSPNFREHPGGLLVRELFDFHHSSEFEIHLFSLIHTGDFVAEHIRSTVDYHHDVSGWNSLDIASLINRTGIDILVSLAGYNENMNMEVLALRPAPIQLMAVGYHETTGASFIDYVFSDESMMDSALRDNYKEQVITFPCSSLFNSQLPVDETLNTTKIDYGLPEDKFIYASFNHPRKLDPDTFDAWTQILKAVPNSVLWLFDGGMDAYRKSILEIAESSGIRRDQLVFAPPIDLQSHWERIKHADLFLDTFTYNAHMTGIEALRMGVPMITLRGNSHNSRLCSSLLHYSGLQNCTIFTKNDYIHAAISAASNQSDLVDIRKKLLSNNNNVLFDTELQVRYLEKAYKIALVRNRKGLPPKDFSVGSALQMNSLL